MARPIKNTEGARRERRVTLAFTKKFYSDVAAMARLRDSSINELIIDCMQKVIDKNSARLEKFREDSASNNLIDTDAD